MNQILHKIQLHERLGNLNWVLQKVVQHYSDLSWVKPEILERIKYYVKQCAHIISPETIEAITSLPDQDLSHAGLRPWILAASRIKPVPKTGTIPFPAVSSVGIVRELSVAQDAPSSLAPERIKLLDDTGSALIKAISRRVSGQCVWRPECYNFQILDVFGNDDPAVKGSSMGLPLALALCSKILDEPLPGDLSASGVVGRDGYVRPVTSMETKLEVLKHERFFVKRVMVSSDQDLTSVPAGLQIIKVRSISDAINIAFPERVHISNICVPIDIEAELASLKKQYEGYLIDTCEENASQLISYLEQSHLPLPKNRSIRALFICYWRKGCCHCHKGESGEADKSLSKAMGLYRKHPGLILPDEYFELKNQYGVLLKDLFKYRQAEKVHTELIKEMESALCLDHTRGANLSSLSQLYLAQCRYEDAEKYQRMAIRLVSEDEKYRNYGYLAQIHTRAGNFRKAARALSLARKSFAGAPVEIQHTKKPFLDWIEVEFLYWRGFRSVNRRKQVFQKLYAIASEYSALEGWVAALINKFRALAMLLEGKHREGLQGLDEVISFFHAQFAPVLRVLGASVKAQRALYFLKANEIELAMEDMRGILEDLSFQKDIRVYFKKELGLISRLLKDRQWQKQTLEQGAKVLKSIIAKIPY